MKSKQKELSDPVCGLSVREWVMELAEEAGHREVWGFTGPGPIEQQFLTKWMNPCSLDPAHCPQFTLMYLRTPGELSASRKDMTGTQLRSKCRQAPHTSEVDPSRILTFSFCTGSGSVSTHRFLRFAAKHIVGTCYCQWLRKAGSLAQQGLQHKWKLWLGLVEGESGVLTSLWGPV